jgi:hypothetical protein
MSGRVNWLLTENQTENQGFQSKTQCQVGADGKPDGKLASIGSCGVSVDTQDTRIIQIN